MTPTLECSLDGYLLSKNPHPLYMGTSLIRNSPPPLGPPYDPRHRSTVGSLEGAVSYERGTPVSLVKEATHPSRASRDVDELAVQREWEGGRGRVRTRSDLVFERGRHRKAPHAMSMRSVADEGSRARPGVRIPLQ